MLETLTDYRLRTKLGILIRGRYSAFPFSLCHSVCCHSCPVGPENLCHNSRGVEQHLPLIRKVRLGYAVSYESMFVLKLGGLHLRLFAYLFILIWFKKSGHATGTTCFWLFKLHRIKIRIFNSLSRWFLGVLHF